MSQNETVIKVSDNIPNSIKRKLGDIAKASELAQKSLMQFKNVLKGMNDDPFNKYSNSINVFTETISKYKELINPIEQCNEELNRQTELMKLSTEQQIIMNNLDYINQNMISKNVDLLQNQNNELRENIELNKENNQMLAIKESLQKNSQYSKNSNFEDLTTNLIDLKKSNSNFTQSDVINALNTDSNSPFAGMLSGTWELIQAQLEQYEMMYSQIDQLRENDLINEETATSLKAQVWAKQNDVILGQAGNFFGQLAQLQNSSNSTMAKVGKAAAIAQAIVSTYQSANSAFAAMAGIPYVGPALGAAAAAAAIATGMANVAAIRSQSTGFMIGGYTGDIARNQIAGVVHGQEFVMNASATQRIGVNNLEALQRGDINDFQSPQVGNNYTQAKTEDSIPQTVSPIINIALVSDTQTAEQWLSTQEGIKQIMQINRDNGDELAMIVSAS